MSVDAYEKIPGRYGISITRSGEQAVTTRLPLESSVARRDGSLRPAAILMAADMACGMAAGLGIAPDWTVTADTEVRILERCTVGPLRVDAECARPGRHQSLATARAYDEGSADRLVAVITANHGVLEPKWDTFMAHTPIGSVHRFHRPDDDVMSLEDTFGVEIRDVEDGPQVVVAPVDDRTRNPWGIFHGGLTGLLLEDAAALAGISDPHDIVARFMRAIRVGPAEARIVEVIERDSDRLALIEVWDVGADRLAVLGTVSD